MVRAARRSETAKLIIRMFLEDLVTKKGRISSEGDQKSTLKRKNRTYHNYLCSLVPGEVNRPPYNLKINIKYAMDEQK